jgi:hypothetical protein
MTRETGIQLAHAELSREHFNESLTALSYFGTTRSSPIMTAWAAPALQPPPHCRSRYLTLRRYQQWLN